MNITRRDLFKFAAGFVAFIPAGRALVDSSPPELYSDIVEEYEDGEVVHVTPKRLVIQTIYGKVTLHLSSKTEVWENRFVREIPIQSGDRVIAWGKRRKDGSRDVERIWINLANLQGQITSPRALPEGSEFEQHDLRDGRTKVRIDPRTLIAVADTPKQPLKERHVEFAESQFLQVIGRRLNDGTVLATDVYAD